MSDLVNELVKIREAVNSIEVRGERNAALVVYCFGKCNEAIKMVTDNLQAVSQKEQRGDVSEQH